MNVWLNGERSDVAPVQTVAELAASLGLAANTVLIEHNGVALRQREWAERKISDGDRIEFLRVVAGG